MGIKVRKSISNLQTYNVGGRSDLSSDWECFDWNESEFPPTNKVFEVMKSFYRYERYPDITAKQLKNKLSEYVSLPVNFIEVYNGSDDALKDIINVFVDKETNSMCFIEDSILGAKTKLAPEVNPDRIDPTLSNIG